jgi:hypothetical protein
LWSNIAETTAALIYKSINLTMPTRIIMLHSQQ